MVNDYEITLEGYAWKFHFIEKSVSGIVNLRLYFADEFIYSSDWNKSNADFGIELCKRLNRQFDYALIEAYRDND